MHSLYFNAFLELWLHNYLQKMRGYPHFSFWFPITVAKNYFFPVVITFAKNTSVLGGTALKSLIIITLFLFSWFTKHKPT